MALNARPYRPGRQSGVRFHWQLVIFAALLSLLLSAIVIVPVFPSAVGPEVRVGFPAPYTLKSPVTTRYVSQILTRADREAAVSTVVDVYRFDPSITAQARQSLSETLGILETILYDPAFTSTERLERLTRIEGVSLTTGTRDLLLTLAETDWWALDREALRLYDLLTYDQFNVGQVRQIRAQDLETLRVEMTRRISPTFAVPKRRVIEELLGPFLVPNYVVDGDETARRRQEAQDRTPPHYVDILEGELIVYEGQIVRDTDLEKMEAAGLRNPTVSWLNAGGHLALVAGLVACYCLYLFQFQEKAFQDTRNLFLIGLVMVVAMVGAKVMVPGRVGLAYAFPLPTASILLALLLNPMVAVGATIILAVLAGVLGGPSLSLAVLGLAGGLVGILGVWKAQRLSTFFLTGVFITLANMVVVGAFRLIAQALDLQPLATAALACAINGFASVILGFATFGFLGSLFGRVTVLQLMELSNPNHPLLHRLMREAPGTYYHSIVVGNLAERAAEVIGADPMLVRVGAYFHDIGKVIRPYFFVDNQAGRTNIHDDLPPRSSAQIITDHVRDGVALARKYRLPERIVQFIPQHHGTTTAAYFYRRALQQEETVNPDDFRYPGPRPQSREAAILMLADSVEATVRSMNQSGKLKEVLEGKEGEGEDPLMKLVTGIIAERVREGQLDESDLTFRDLKDIQQSFAEMLRGVYHPRVVYPEFGKGQEGPRETSDR
jgi:putative nucleotidyltransferase with HDIG domain